MTPHRHRYSARFYRRAPDILARALLGKRLVHGNRSGIIVETEAYLGPEDLASHARFGPTARNRGMFEPGGNAYVYLCYGVHDMFNITAGGADQIGAVLIRGVAPGPGLPDDPHVARGPGKVARALGITRDHDGIDLTADGPLYVTRGRAVASDRIARGPRIGVDYAGAWAERPLRFFVRDHPAVSRPRNPRRAPAAATRG